MPFERNLWTWLRDGVKPLIANRTLHIVRIENLLGKGHPDVEGCLCGNTFHLELKGADRPARPSTPVDVGIEREQVLWLKRRWDAGGSCFVLIRVGAGRQIRRYMVRGDQADLLEAGMTEDQIMGISVMAPHTEPLEVLMAATRYKRLYVTPPTR